MICEGPFAVQLIATPSTSTSGLTSDALGSSLATTISLRVPSRARIGPNGMTSHSPGLRKVVGHVALLKGCPPTVHAVTLASPSVHRDSAAIPSSGSHIPPPHWGPHAGISASETPENTRPLHTLRIHQRSMLARGRGRRSGVLGHVFVAGGGSAPLMGKTPRPSSLRSMGASASAFSIVSATAGSHGLASRSDISSGTNAF